MKNYSIKDTYLCHVLDAIGQRAYDHDAVEQVERHAVRRDDVAGALDCAAAAIRGEYDDGRQRRLERSMQVREALDVEHVHLVDEQHARHEFGYALIDVLVHHLVDLLAQLVYFICCCCLSCHVSSTQ